MATINRIASSMAPLLLAIAAACSSCSSDDNSSPSRSPQDILMGRWKSKCQPHSSTEPIYNSAKSNTYQLSFNQSDAWVYQEFFSDTECREPTFRSLHSGTYELETFSGTSLESTGVINYSFTSLTAVLYDEPSIQFSNNSAFCGGGFSAGVPKRSLVTECDLPKIPWTPKPFALISIKDGVLYPGLYSAEKTGMSKEIRPAAINYELPLERQ